MLLHCERCGAQVHEGIDSDPAAACGACVAAPEGGQAAAQPPPPASRALALSCATVPQPEGITVFKGASFAAAPWGYRDAPTRAGVLTLERRWGSLQYAFLGLFSLIWNGCLILLYGDALREGRIFDVPFPLLHVIAGIWMTYTSLAGLLNRTRVRVTDAAIEISHGPVPWPGNRRLPADDVKRLFCEERGGERGTKTYALSALRGDDTTLRLLTLPSPDQALFIEQCVGRRLGLADGAGGGEYGG
jgi:hypothetical protein